MNWNGWWIVALLWLVAGCYHAWLYIWRCIRTRQPPLSWTPRSTVPWNGIDIFLFVVLLVAAQLFAHVVLVRLGHLPEEPAKEVAAQADPDNAEPTAHPIGRLLEEDRRTSTWLFCAISAVLIAPIVEEFFFRVVLQGWLEGLGSRHVESNESNGRPAWFPIIATSLLFAIPHFRTGSDDIPILQLRTLLIADAVTKSATLLMAIASLRFIRGASWSDLGIGWVPLRRLGAATAVSFLAAVPPLYALQWALFVLLDGRTSISPDPIPLFFFSLVLGYLYRQTHRIWYPLLLHMALNAATLIGLFSSLG